VNRKTLLLLSCILMLLLVVLVLIVTSSESEVRYTITDLGVLPGAERSFATDINDLGEVVGTSGGADSRPAFMWRSSTGRVDLRAIGNQPRVNNRGEVTGFSYLKSATGSIRHALVWSATEGIKDLGTFGKDRSRSIAINDRGDVLVHALWENKPALGGSVWQSKAFICESSGSVRPLMATQEATLRLVDINNERKTIGTLRTEKDRVDAFVWNPETGFYIPEGADSLRLHRINNRGIAVGGRIIGPNEVEAVLWRDNEITPLSGLGGDYCVARDVNDRKQIVGYSTTRTGDRIESFREWQGEKGSGLKKLLRPLATNLGESTWGWQKPVLWVRGEPMDLNDAIPPDSGWILWDAEAINNSGQIVGTGVFHGELRAYLLTPIAETAKNRD
jgi:probable HAF family extracellular repeat protein